jgi:integrase
MPRSPEIHQYVAVDGTVSYWISYRWEGRRKHETFQTFEAAKEAVARLVYLRTIRAAPAKMRGKSLTLAEFIALEGEDYKSSGWWIRHVKRRCSPSYIQNLRYDLDRWVGPRSGDREPLSFCLGNYPLADIDTDVVDVWTNWMEQEGATASTMTKLMSIVSGILTKAKTWRYLDPKADNPFNTTERPEYSPDPPERALDAEQIYKLKAAMETEQDSLIVSLLAFVFLRMQEARPLIWSDLIDADGKPRKRLRVKRTVSGDVVREKKGKSKAALRLIPIPEPVQAEIAAFYLASGKPDGDQLVFTDSDGGMLNSTNWRNRCFYPATQRSGLAAYAKKQGFPKITPHACRDTACTLAAIAGIPTATISVWVGHGSEQVTETYYKTIFEDADKVTVRKSMDDQIREARDKVRQPEGRKLSPRGSIYIGYEAGYEQTG